MSQAAKTKDLVALRKVSYITCQHVSNYVVTFK